MQPSKRDTNRNRPETASTSTSRMTSSTKTFTSTSVPTTCAICTNSVTASTTNWIIIQRKKLSFTPVTMRRSGSTPLISSEAIRYVRHIICLMIIARLFSRDRNCAETDMQLQMIEIQSRFMKIISLKIF